jgi:ferredoxin
MKAKWVPVVDASKCTGCGRCVEVCGVKCRRSRKELRFFHARTFAAAKSTASVSVATMVAQMRSLERRLCLRA